MNTKLHKVLAYLIQHGSITKDQMRHNCFYSNGGDAIFKLRKHHNIERIWEETPTGAKYARYIYKGPKREGEAAA